MKLQSITYSTLALIIVGLSIIISCKNNKKSSISNKKVTSTIKYAKGFDIIESEGSKTLVVKSAYKNVNNSFSYQILKRDNNTAKKSSNSILVPVKNIVVTSTTHIPMVELLNEETSIMVFLMLNMFHQKKPGY